MPRRTNCATAASAGPSSRRSLLEAWPSFKGSDWPWILSLAGIVFVTFRSGLDNGFVGDDWVLIDWCRPKGIGFVLEVFNPVLDAWYYRPVTKLVFGLAYTLFGLSPGPYHLLSLASHALAAVLLFFVVRQARADAFQSFLCALLFAVHFRQHESVFWFSAISYPLSTSLGLSSMLLFRSHLERRHRGYFWGSLVALAGAMLTKDTAAVFPLLVGLYALLFSSPPLPRDFRRGLARLVPLGIVFILVTALQAAPVEGRLFARGGASFSPKDLAATMAFVKQAIVLSVPGLDALRGWVQVAAAAVAGIGLVGFALARRSRIALFGLAWVALAHLPFYLFVPQTGDLYQYLPLAGGALVVGDASRLALRRAPLTPLRASDLPRAALAFTLGVLFLWSVARIRLIELQWHAAGEVVSGVADAVRAADARRAPGEVLAFEGLPDRINGRYAFLNAAPSVFRLLLNDDSLRSAHFEPGVAGYLWEDWRFFRVDAEGERRLLRSFEALEPLGAEGHCESSAAAGLSIEASARLDGSTVTVEVALSSGSKEDPVPVTLFVDVYAAENPLHPDRHFAFWTADLAKSDNARMLRWEIDLASKDFTVTVDNTPVTGVAGATAAVWKGPFVEGALKGVLAARRADSPERTVVFDLFWTLKTGDTLSGFRARKVRGVLPLDL